MLTGSDRSSYQPRADVLLILFRVYCVSPADSINGSQVELQSRALSRFFINNLQLSRERIAR